MPISTDSVDSAATVAVRALAVLVASLVGCGDDAAVGSGGGGGGGAGGGGGDQAATSGSGGAGTASVASGATTSGGVGGASTTVGAGGANACGDVLIGDGSPVECAGSAAASMPLEDQAVCPEDSSVYWPGKLYALDVVAGECLHMQVDNAGSPAGADLFGALVDPGGKSLLFDEEMDCTVANPEGYLCPAGAVTVETTGRALVVVGVWEGEGCPVSTTTPFQLVVSRDGVDQDLSDAFLCEGDLLEIIP